MTKAIIVAGQYANGKTQTIRGLISGAVQREKRVGAFVAESANVAPDAKRYDLGDEATGVSFASICCPTLEDMVQAMDSALEKKEYDLLFIEPPGNMHPPLMAQLAVDKGFSLEHVLMLVSQRDFDTDRHMQTFHSGLEIANIVGVTHAYGNPLRDDIKELVQKTNRDTEIVSFQKAGLQYDSLMSHPKWSLGRLVQLNGFDASHSHSDHYHQVMRVINPELSLEQVEGMLKEIAATGLIDRAKGPLPKYNKEIDMKGKYLEISTPDKELSPKSLGYLIFFAKNHLPEQSINKLAMAPQQRTREVFEDSSLESKVAVFGKYYHESSRRTREVLANGEVVHSYTPLDQAEKVAMEILKDAGDDSALRMVLPLYHGTRLYALQELEKRKGKMKSFVGTHVSAVLINTSLYSGEGFPDYPRLADQHQLRKIKEQAVPAFFLYASQLNEEDIKDFPRYEPAVGPYFLKAAKTAWSHAGERVSLPMRRQTAKSMAEIHGASGFSALSEQWARWGKEL